MILHMRSYDFVAEIGGIKPALETREMMISKKVFGMCGKEPSA